MNNNLKHIAMLSLSGALVCSSCADKGNSRWMPTQYPEARQDSTVVDEYFGHQVADPYRWLENDTSSETSAWVAEQQALTDEYFAHIPFRDAYKNRLETLQNYERVSAPGYAGGRFFFSKNDGLQNQAVIYTQKTIDDTPEVFLDPNTLSTDGTVAYAGLSLSHDGRYAAYQIHRNGSDWTEIYVMDVETKQLLDDHIVWAKFTGAAWHGDGFYFQLDPVRNGDLPERHDLSASVFAKNRKNFPFIYLQRDILISHDTAKSLCDIS